MRNQTWDPNSDSWPATPVGRAAKGFLLSQHFSRQTMRSYGTVLAEFASSHASRDLWEFEPPNGTSFVEEFLRDRWGTSASRTYNKNLTVFRGFFGWLLERDRMTRDPTLSLKFRKKDGVVRDTFTQEEVDTIFRENPDPRDRVPLRLLLRYALTKGELQRLRFGDVDRDAQEITVHTKSGQVQARPIVDGAFWADFDRLVQAMAPGPKPDDFVMVARRTVVVRKHVPGEREFSLIEARLQEAVESAERLERAQDLEPANLSASIRDAQTRLGRAIMKASETNFWKPGREFGDHGLHDWWYRCLERAGIVEAGVSSGMNMNMARRTAGQLFFDATGDIKGLQTLMGHASIQSTALSFSKPDVERLKLLLRHLESSLPDGEGA